RKLICFGSFRNGSFRFSLAKLSRSLIQSHLSIFLIQSDYHMFKCKLFPSILAHIRGLTSVVFASHYRGTNTACWGVPQSPYILSQLRNILAISDSYTKICLADFKQKVSPFLVNED